MSEPRHEFYETDEKLTLSIFDKGADPAKVLITFGPEYFVYRNDTKVLELKPLKGRIDPDKSDYTVGKVKVEVRLVKATPGRWDGLVGEPPIAPAVVDLSYGAALQAAQGTAAKKPRKNWDGITTSILEKEKDKTTEEDPNTGGDAAVNSFFRQLYEGADEDTKRAMLKSFQESGGTALSTNWDEVGKAPMEVKPPQGSEYKKWGL